MTSIPVPSVILNKTFVHNITNISFGNLSIEIMNEIFQDGRPFSHFIEQWLAINYPIIHEKGCKSYDHKDSNNCEILYEQKTFTKLGCKFCPSNMLGEGRKFNKEIFEEKAKKLIYIIVSNIDFPEIKIKFVRGTELLKQYPTSKIPLKDFDKFFD